MKAKTIKEKMKNYRDFFGGDLICLDEIEKATTKDELNSLLNKHSSYLDLQQCDAQSHLEEFRKTLFNP